MYAQRNSTVYLKYKPECKEMIEKNRLTFLKYLSGKGKTPIDMYGIEISNVHIGEACSWGFEFSYKTYKDITQDEIKAIGKWFGNSIEGIRIEYYAKRTNRFGVMTALIDANVIIHEFIPSSNNPMKDADGNIEYSWLSDAFDEGKEQHVHPYTDDSAVDPTFPNILLWPNENRRPAHEFDI